jgi:hypothetical protein
MIDTLALTIALLSAPVTRPNMDRTSKIIAPIQTALVQVVTREAKKSEMLSTCYQNAYGSCWSEN